MTQSLQGLAASSSPDGTTDSPTEHRHSSTGSLGGPSSGAVPVVPTGMESLVGITGGGSIGHGGSTRSNGGGGGTVGRGSTIGIRMGRKWDEALEAGEEKKRKEEAADAAHSKAQAAAHQRVGEDTFAPPTEAEEGATPPAATAAAASSSSSPAAIAATTPSPQVGGDKKYVARFVGRRGKQTLNKKDCLCTTILIHSACPEHGDKIDEHAAAEATDDAAEATS